MYTNYASIHQLLYTSRRTEKSTNQETMANQKFYQLLNQIIAALLSRNRRNKVGRRLRKALHYRQ